MLASLYGNVSIVNGKKNGSTYQKIGVFYNRKHVICKRGKPSNKYASFGMPPLVMGSIETSTAIVLEYFGGRLLSIRGVLLLCDST